MKSKSKKRRPAAAKWAICKEFAKYEFSVLNVCKTIHCAATGSIDYPSDVVRIRMTEWLRWRIHHAWDVGHDSRREFDDAVKRLALATLQEEKTAWWNTHIYPSPPESDTQKERKRIASFLRTLRLNARANAKTLADMIERGDHEQPNP